MFIGIGLGLIPQAMTGSSVDALLGGNPLDLYGQAAFLFDVPRSNYRNGTSQVGDFSSLTGLTFTRALAAYAPNSAGVLQLFASGAPRITDRGLLIEGARTNLCLRSQEFDNASWIKTAGGAGTLPVVTADAATAPDGTLTADQIVCVSGGSAGTDRSMITQSVTIVTGTVYCVTIYVRAVSGSASFNLTVAGAATNATTTVTATTTWQRVQVLTSGGAETSVQIRLGLTGGANLTTSYYIWGAQLE